MILNFLLLLHISLYIFHYYTFTLYGRTFFKAGLGVVWFDVKPYIGIA